MTRTYVSNPTYTKNSVHEIDSPEESNAKEHMELMVNQVYAALKAATDYADTHGLRFTWDPDPTNNSYYLHGAYQGKGNSTKDKPTRVREWRVEDYDYKNPKDEYDGWGWFTSSDEC